MNFPNEFKVKKVWPPIYEESKYSGIEDISGLVFWHNENKAFYVTKSKVKHLKAGDEVIFRIPFEDLDTKGKQAVKCRHSKLTILKARVTHSNFEELHSYWYLNCEEQ